MTSSSPDPADTGEAEDPRAAADIVVTEYLDERLNQANDPPGIREAVITRLIAARDGTATRGKAQIRQLRARSPYRPAVYYAHEETLENELQQAAAGIRTAMAMEGHIVDPILFEQAATFRLASTAAWAIRSEATRVPRPPTRPDSLAWTLPPVPWLDADDDAWPPPEAAALDNQSDLPGEPPTCGEAPYEDWVQLGFIERHRTLATKHPQQPSRRYSVSVGLEVTNGEEPSPYQPFSRSVPSIWTHTTRELAPKLSSPQAHANLASLCRHLACVIDFDNTPGAPDPDRGPGLHPFLLAPHIEVVALLGLRPEAPPARLALIDDQGPGLVCRTWNAYLIHDGNNEPLEYAVTGTDLLLRPDLYQRIRGSVGPDRFRLGLSVIHAP